MVILNASYFQSECKLESTTVVFTPYVPVCFWPKRHSFGDIELKFCILSRLTHR